MIQAKDPFIYNSLKHDISVHALPPWQQKIFSSIIAAMGRQLKQSVKVFQSFILNLRLPVDKQR